jgi:hypothetical protein
VRQVLGFIKTMVVGGMLFLFPLVIVTPLDAEMLDVNRVFDSLGKGTAAAMAQAPERDGVG